MYRYSLILLVAALASALSAAADPGQLYRGPYLQQATSESVVVVWRTQGATTPVLRYGPTPDNLATEVRGDAITLRVSADVSDAEDAPRLYQESSEEAAKRNSERHDPSTAANTYQFEASVSGLTPNSKFFYAIYDGDQRLAGGDVDHYFITHRAIGSATDMRIWVVGDSGTGDRNQAMVHEAMQAYTAKTHRSIDHYLHVGDMAYGRGTDQEFQHNFFEPYQETLRNTVCWPSMGNHEGGTSRGISGTGPYYDAYVVPTAAEVGGVPSGTEAYYSFDISEVHFICLDSHDLDRGPDAAMAQWLRADLEQTKAKWLIAFWHHPPYTKGSHDSDTETQLIEMREVFMPILESAGVDLTLTGHSHIYERSMLMDGAYATPTVAENVILDDGDGNPSGDGAYEKSEGLNPNEGSVNIVAGHGGTGNSRRGTMPVMREIIVEHGSVILDIKGDTLTGTMLDKFGATRDLFSIVKRGNVTPTRIENPWQPVHDLSQITRLEFSFGNDAPGTVPEYWSVAAGNAAGLGVAASDDGNRQFLRATADSKPLIGKMDAATIQRFNYETHLRLPAEGGKAAGLVFGYTDDANYWRVVVDRESGKIRGSRIQNGTETVLVEKDTEIPAGEWIKLECDDKNGKLEIQFQDDLTFELDPGVALPDAHLGFYIPAGGTAEFLRLRIER